VSLKNNCQLSPSGMVGCLPNPQETAGSEHENSPYHCKTNKHMKSIVQSKTWPQIQHHGPATFQNHGKQNMTSEGWMEDRWAHRLTVFVVRQTLRIIASYANWAVRVTNISEAQLSANLSFRVSIREHTCCNKKLLRLREWY